MANPELWEEVGGNQAVRTTGISCAARVWVQKSGMWVPALALPQTNDVILIQSAHLSGSIPFPSKYKLLMLLLSPPKSSETGWSHCRVKPATER